MSAVPAELRERVEAWIAGDLDPATREELRRLLAEGAVEELEDRFAAPLRFGTAGLRGVVGAGPNRMNRAVVIRATAGLAAYLRDRFGAETGPVVVGRDARLSSPVFLEDTVAVLAAAGFRVRVAPGTTPTPAIAFAALDEGAIAAIAITASHNPPEYNGYKVYADNGAQIIPPVDVEIAQRIDVAPPAIEVPRVETPFDHPLVSPIADLRDRYLAAVEEEMPSSSVSGPAVVYTPLHGVGGSYAVEVLRPRAAAVHPVAAQMEPDGRFPTVRFPNPEEPGAMDLALAEAERTGVDVAIANDPDADRLAAAVRQSGQMRMLTGDQLGVALADHLLERRRTPERPILITTVVSSPMLGAIAREADAVFATTLTGFKWIWNAALALMDAGEGRFLFGYEEALGYSVWGRVRDKDGITAAAAFVDLVADDHGAGRSVWDRLEALYRRYGLWASAHHNVVRPGVEGMAEIAAAVERAAADPPGQVAGRPVTEVVDYRTGGEARPFWLPNAPMIEYRLGGDGRIVVRPSGTEPKLKIYVHLRAAEVADDVWAHERRLAEEAAVAGAEVARRIGIEA